MFFHIFTRRKKKNNLREFEPQNSKNLRKSRLSSKMLSLIKKKCTAVQKLRNSEIQTERYG